MSSLPASADQVGQPDGPAATAADTPRTTERAPALAALEARLGLGDRVRRRAAVLRPVVRVIRSVVALGMFAGAVAGGVLVYASQMPAPTLGEYPAIPTAAEPAVAHEIVELIVANDAPALAARLEAESLEALSGALRTVQGNPQPLVEVTDIKYLGAVTLDDQTVVSYLAKGRDAIGEKWVVGFALRVQGDSVVGVN